MTRVSRELDLRHLPPPKRQPEIFRTFDALQPGEAFILVDDHDLKPLLCQFQAERPGRFEWSVLEAGPERFRIEMSARAAEGLRNVSEYLGGDHRRLDGIVAEVEDLVERRSFPDADRRFAEFACGLDRHIEMEEQVLFPFFEKATGVANGPTKVMRLEHVEIRRLLAEVASAIKAQEGGRFADAVAALKQLLGDHDLKEEQILYPTTDRAAVDARERDDLVRRMQAL